MESVDFSLVVDGRDEKLIGFSLVQKHQNGGAGREVCFSLGLNPYLVNTTSGASQSALP